MNDLATSVRPVGPGAGPGPMPAPMPPGVPAQRPRIVLFDDTGMNGRSVVLEGDVTNFEQIRFNDRVASAVVESGTWVLCEHEEYRGRCITLGPGRYLTLQDMNNVASSARVADGRGPDVRPPEPPRPQVRGAILYSQRGMQGRSVVLERQVVRNLEQLGFNDRASSVRIEQGYWLLCSDADFEGECRTFGPGDYPALPPGLDNRISSARRISNYYPYRETPNWR